MKKKYQIKNSITKKIVILLAIKIRSFFKAARYECKLLLGIFNLCDCYWKSK